MLRESALKELVRIENALKEIEHILKTDMQIDSGSKTLTEEIAKDLSYRKGRINELENLQSIGTESLRTKVLNDLNSKIETIQAQIKEGSDIEKEFLEKLKTSLEALKGMVENSESSKDLIKLSKATELLENYSSAPELLKNLTAMNKVFGENADVAYREISRIVSEFKNNKILLKDAVNKLETVFEKFGQKDLFNKLADQGERELLKALSEDTSFNNIYQQSKKVNSMMNVKLEEKQQTETGREVFESVAENLAKNPSYRAELEAKVNAKKEQKRIGIQKDITIAENKKEATVEAELKKNDPEYEKLDQEMKVIGVYEKAYKGLMEKEATLKSNMEKETKENPKDLSESVELIDESVREIEKSTQEVEKQL
ncbi:MAG: hypothetical protein ACD_79C01471G0001, partial [uncultured bacterium]